MFAGFAFAQSYFAGILNIIRRHARGVGGSGLSPDWGALMEEALTEQDRRRRRELEEQEILDLITAGLL